MWYWAAQKNTFTCSLLETEQKLDSSWASLISVVYLSELFTCWLHLGYVEMIPIICTASQNREENTKPSLLQETQIQANRCIQQYSLLHVVASPSTWKATNLRKDAPMSWRVVNSLHRQRRKAWRRRTATPPRANFEQKQLLVCSQCMCKYDASRFYLSKSLLHLEIGSQIKASHVHSCFPRNLSGLCFLHNICSVRTS